MQDHVYLVRLESSVTLVPHHALLAQLESTPVTLVRLRVPTVQRALLPPLSVLLPALSVL